MKKIILVLLLFLICNVIDIGIGLAEINTANQNAKQNIPVNSGKYVITVNSEHVIYCVPIFDKKGFSSSLKMINGGVIYISETCDTYYQISP